MHVLNLQFVISAEKATFQREKCLAMLYKQSTMSIVLPFNSGCSWLRREHLLRPCYTRQFFLQLATQRWRIKNLSSCRGGVTRVQKLPRVRWPLHYLRALPTSRVHPELDGRTRHCPFLKKLPTAQRCFLPSNNENGGPSYLTTGPVLGHKRVHAIP